MTNTTRGGTRRALATLGRVAGITIVPLALAALPVGAQTVAERAAKIENGVVHLSYAARPGVCGNGSTNISTNDRGRRTYTGNGSITIRGDSREWEDDECTPGPVRVSVTVEDRQPQSVRVYVGGSWRPGGDAVTDLGTVSAPQAADWLLDLAERQPRGSSERVGSNAILGAIIADSTVVWPRLMKIARDENRPRETRRQAVFWLSQAAGDAATAGLDTLVGEAALDRDVREQAVFALSQRPREEGVPALIRIARTNKDPEIRRKALFWLGQSNDPRALALFEELLEKH